MKHPTDRSLPWNRQLGESAKAYEAFRAYRDLGPTRSLARAGQRLGKSTCLMEDWSTRWDWVYRVRAYDAHLEQQQRQAQEQARLEMYERHAKLAMSLQAKGLQRLQSMEPESMEASDVLRYIIDAAKFERLSRGESTDKTDINVHEVDAQIEQLLAQVASRGRTAH